MYICYLDESGTVEPLGTSHFVLGGVAIPALQWKSLDGEISCIKAKYSLENEEIHTGWMLRRYIEQEKIPDFEKLDPVARRKAVSNERNIHIRIMAVKNSKRLREISKNYNKTEAYTHLTFTERIQLIREVCDKIGSWTDVRLFAEAYDKGTLTSWPTHFPTMYEHAFNQIISRFQNFLVNKGNYAGIRLHGLIVQDNNETIAKKLTKNMRLLHKKGTFYSNFDRIIETPLFVDSSLTSMVQIADVCCYSTRRFFENNETDLFNRIYSRFDRARATVVGIRHFIRAGTTCTCRVCQDHNI